MKNSILLISIFLSLPAIGLTNQEINQTVKEAYSAMEDGCDYWQTSYEPEGGDNIDYKVCMKAVNGCLTESLNKAQNTANFKAEFHHELQYCFEDKL